MIFISQVNTDDIDAMNNSEITTEYSKAEKDKILQYLRKYDVFAYTSVPAKDVFTGDTIAEYDNGRTDGEYVWYESTIYYFEKYNIKLKKEFIDKIV